MKKTAEEILKGYDFDKLIALGVGLEEAKPIILDAMEEYADQFKIDLPTEGRKLTLKELEDLFNLEQQLNIPLKDRFHKTLSDEQISELTCAKGSYPAEQITLPTEQEQEKLMLTFLDHYESHRGTYLTWKPEDVVKTWLEIRRKLIISINK